LGYHGNLVKEFLQLAYPERKFTFVEIDKFQGPGSSLAYTFLQAKEYLQCPFIFHAGDTVVLEPVPSPVTENWNGGFKGGSTANYRSFTELDDKVYDFHEKGSVDYDYLHIGLVGIKDFKQFWQAVDEVYKSDPNNQSLGDVPVLEKLIKEYFVLVPREFRTWLDIGNIEALNGARQKLGEHLVNLDKPDEATYIFDDKSVIKFMADEKVVANRVKRAEILGHLVPSVDGSAKHFYRYPYASGRLYSRILTPPDFENFLQWAKVNLWKPEKEASDEEFKKICLDFYKNKTLKRIEQFYGITNFADGPLTINGQSVPPLSEAMEKIDFDWLSSGRQTGFHGDFILDNIIRTPDGYKLLDWRQDFGGLMKSGDMYYDLAKMNHNLTVNHDMVFGGQFTVRVRGSVVFADILRPHNLVVCQQALHDFIKTEGLDLKKVKILSAMVWLNSAPLHHHPYNLFLYYFGRLNLWRAINE
jgi:hypothetical protein